jgi:hypothetical protein
METPWSETVAPPPDPAWSMAPPASSDSPWAVAPQTTADDWPAAPPASPAANELWDSSATPESTTDWSPAPAPAKPARSAPSSAAHDDASWSAPPPAAGEHLSPEPEGPRWSGSAKPEFAPLAPGESLASDEEEAPKAIDESEVADLLRPVVDDASALLRPVDGAANDAPGAVADPHDHPDLLVPVEDKPVAATAGELVTGEHRVAIHALGGRTRRGTVTSLDLSRAQFALQPQGGGPPEIVAHSELKAIFFMLAPGENALAPSGQRVRVTFSDGRSIEGHRDGPDLHQGFFLVPLDAQKTNTRRIYVANGAVASVTDLD